jgi:hypothetical protein
MGIPAARLLAYNTLRSEEKSNAGKAMLFDREVRGSRPGEARPISMKMAAFKVSGQTYHFRGCRLCLHNSFSEKNCADNPASASHPKSESKIDLE